MKKTLFIFSLLISSLFIISCSNSLSDDLHNTYHITRDSYNKSNLKEILKSESSEELASRSFSTNEPIQATINKDGKLVITSYAPVMVTNVEVFASSSPIALIDEVYGFSQAILDIDTSSISKDTKLSIRSNDPFMKKINKITSPMKVNFSQDNSGPWQALDTKRSREAAILALTMSYMFNHEEYLPHILKWNDGGYVGHQVIYTLIPGVISFTWLDSRPFLDDDGSTVDGQTVYNRALGVKNLNFSAIKQDEPAGGVGGGTTLGVRDYLYDRFVSYETFPWNGQKQQDLKCYIVDAIFHEFAHCMGFYHFSNPYKGTMTYNGGWTTANYVFLNHLIENDDLPIRLDGKWESKTGFPSSL